MTMMNGAYSSSLAKAVLLRNGNVKPSMLVAHVVSMKETRSHKNLLRSYQLLQTQLIVGLQLGYTKYMRFLCLWHSRDDSNHFKEKA